jgi:hypothetical protein
MVHRRPQFRVVKGVDGGVLIIANAIMCEDLVALLTDLEHRSVTETALMHALREAAQAPTGRAAHGDQG